MNNVYLLFFVAALALLSTIVDVTETEAINLMQDTPVGATLGVQNDELAP
ncbi:hypothetical protein [uncultured Shewanella sp.]|nr:hypothetical protein [uncultured Shewanella sp.]